MSNQRLKPQTTYPAIVGRILEQARKHAGLEQTEVAERCGLSQATYSRIERGDLALTIEQLVQIAAVLKLSPGQVLQRADDAAAGLRNQGIEILPRRAQSTEANAAALIALGALAVLIASILSK